MGKRDKRIDAYIARSAEFARPILRHLREVVHGACPDVAEDIKWGMPAFTYHGLMCDMAAFKAHATFGFWRGAAIVDLGGRSLDEAMGNFGRLTKVSELPSKRVLSSYVRLAMKLNESGAKPRARAKSSGPQKALPVPADLKAALAKHSKARATFAGFSPSHRREYVEWITGAKQAATRASRLAKAIEWMAEGKPQNWKYMKEWKKGR
ncbi:MAG: hypothetical protein HOP12_11855 [Candidatus Eisenbacteria bacterium]|uniref:YdhG-like domain-containing protein n=1 Tax=Eiseniibacteriota bacterium TaxID=2212470 RepID=A0A849SGH6_UNCEI|nr:hypothetical protein [Candidatus Eisenbacteria bacterium]